MNIHGKRANGTMSYYEIHENLSRAITVSLYDDCLNFDHSRKSAYCPLCRRPIEGSLWLGPYRYYLQTKKRPHILFPFGTVGFLWSEALHSAFVKNGLTGVSHVQACEIHYRNEKIDEPYVLPTVAYSGKAIAYAQVKNQERVYNKQLPKCSLCMHQKDLERQSLYFTDEHEYDLFKIYHNPEKIYCTDRFKALCEEMSITNLEFRTVVCR